MINRLILSLLLLLGLGSCTKVENLSADTSLRSFIVRSYSPNSVVMGEIEISADTVYIPIEYGKYNFPLTLTAEAKATAGAYVFGIDPNETIVFETIDAAPLRFVVSAESGVSKNYYLSLREIPLGEDCELYNDVTFSDANGFVSDKLVDYKGRKNIIAIDAQYPLTLTPMFNVAATTEIKSYRDAGQTEWSDFENGQTPLTFPQSGTSYELEIISESGKREVCEVGLSVIDYSLIDQTTQINYRDLTASLKQQGASVKSYDIDFETGEIVIYIDPENSAQVDFPLSLDIDIPINNWLSLIGVEKSQNYTFEGWDDKFDFALLYSDKLTATKWSISIDTYKAPAAEVAVESAATKSFECGKYSFLFFTYQHLTKSTKRPEVEIYAHSHEIVLYYSSYYKPALASSSIPNWWAAYSLDFSLSNGESITKELRWEAKANSGGKITQTEITAAVDAVQTFEVEQADGTVELWSVKLLKDDSAISSECNLLGLNVISSTPSYTEFDDPLYTLDEVNNAIYLNVGDRYDFPLSLDLALEISPYASVEPSTLHFENESDEQKITITAQDATSVKEYTVKLMVPQEVTAPAVTSITFDPLTAGASLMGGVNIDPENCTISIGVEANSTLFPLDITVSDVEVADNGTIDLPAQGTITFNSAESSVIAWVSSADGTARQMWNFEIFYYEQIAGGDMNSWQLSASPVTSTPPWSTPNMSGIASVKNTTPVAGHSGADDDFAAQMATGTSWGKLAAGSIFTGWFDKDNATSLGLSDPVRLTHFGIPFAPDAKIKGIRMDMSYAQAAEKVDWGSITVTLIAAEPSAAFEFHGNKPNDYSDPTAGNAPHPMNTAVEVAQNKMIFGNGTATQTTYNEPISMNVEAGEWVEVFIPIATDKPFTHISIAAASSAYGDYFIGEVGSVMRLDNVKVIYE